MPNESSSSLATSKQEDGSAMAHLSPATEVAIRLLPGNDRCVDCSAICPQWAGVSFGVLLCLACAGKHRSLGVQTSYVKSLVMDSWSQSEVRSLEVGGNAKWIAVCTGIEACEVCMEIKYASGVAKAYKSRVALAAAKDPAMECDLSATSFLTILSGVVSPSGNKTAVMEKSVLLPTTITATQRSNDGTDGSSVKCTTCCAMVPLDQLNRHSHSCTVSPAPPLTWTTYEREFGKPNEPLGFTLVKDTSGYAEVSRIIPGSAAERANMIVGSLLIGLNHSTKHLTFDNVVNTLRTLPRPLLFHFAFRFHIASEGPKVVASIPKPRMVAITVTLQENEALGCSLSTNEDCAVRSVDDGSIAKKHGILVGSRIVAVNGQRFKQAKELIHEICTAQRPIEILVHRVEGLMRGWSK